MFLHLCKHIYIAQFNDDLIVLDTKKDKYTLCFSEVAETLMNLLENNSRSFNQETIQNFIDAHIIEKKDFPFPFFIDRKMKCQGVSNVDWTLPVDYQEVKFSLSVVKALLQLVQVAFYLKKRGFYETIQLVKKRRKKEVDYTIPSEDDLKNLAGVITKACLIYPKKTSCLEWSITFVLMALKRQWKCNLEIGVQNYPFLSCAWVECDGKVIMNNKEFREGMAIILNEPFRKLKV